MVDLRSDLRRAVRETPACEMAVALRRVYAVECGCDECADAVALAVARVVLDAPAVGMDAIASSQRIARITRLREIEEALR